MPLSIRLVSAVLLLITVGLLAWFVLTPESMGMTCTGLSSLVVLLKQAGEQDATLGQRFCDAYLVGSEFCQALPLPARPDPAAVPWEAFCRDRQGYPWPVPGADRPSGLRP